MKVEKVKWYESFWAVLVCFIISPFTAYLSLFPAIIFIILRLIKEIRRIIINKKNNLPINTIIPYGESVDDFKNNKSIDATHKTSFVSNDEDKSVKEIMKEKYPDMTDEDFNAAVKEIVRDNFEIRISGPSRNTERQPKKKYDYTRVRKLVSDFVVLDFETTGLSPVENNIIQIGAIRYVNFELVEEYNTLVNPKEPISSTITKITGITNKDVANAPTIEQVLPSLLEFINTNVIVAHNASFDMKFLLENIERLNLTSEKYRVINTLSLARKCIDETPNHKLPTLKAFLNLDHLESHDALADCKVTGELYKYCYEKNLTVVK